MKEDKTKYENTTEVHFQNWIKLYLGDEINSECWLQKMTTMLDLVVLRFRSGNLSIHTRVYNLLKQLLFKDLTISIYIIDPPEV